MEAIEGVERLLAPGGPVARALAGFELRPQQRELAQAVEETLAAGGHLLAEAGTGVGKSFAYLIPAILHAVQNPTRPVVVSTRTIALQEQLERKDLPFLASVLPVRFAAAVAVGRNNYVCLRRMRRAAGDHQRLFADIEARGELERIVQWSGETRSGLRQDLPFAPSPDVWEQVQAEHGNCLHQRCPHYGPCHYQWGRRRMAEAQVLVVNHSLYLADLALRKAGASYLPDHDVLVLDEAHHLERVATDALSLGVSETKLEWHLTRLLSRHGDRGLLAGRPAGDVPELLKRARSAAEEMGATLEGLLAGGAGAETGTRPLEGALALETDLPGRLGDLAAAMEDLVEREDDLDTRMELRSRTAGILRLARELEVLLSGEDAEGLVRWVERQGRRPVLLGSPLQVREDLSTLLFSRVRSCILVSATMGAGPADKDFSWMRERLGIGEARARSLGSPFRFEERVVVRVEDDMPDPGSDGDAFERESIERLRALLVENGGRALVLCTSLRFADRCHAALEDDLAEHGIPLLRQGSLALGRLVERKRSEPETVLIGADSLWEGIDVPGPGLNLVVVCRLPFAVPTHPLAAARSRAVRDRAGDPFMEISLPEALLRFRQGFGRLIRNMEDRGRVVILDPRVRTKRYGALFLQALPRCPVRWASEG